MQRSVEDVDVGNISTTKLPMQNVNTSRFETASAAIAVLLETMEMSYHSEGFGFCKMMESLSRSKIGRGFSIRMIKTIGRGFSIRMIKTICSGLGKWIVYTL